ncbi:MAG: hypothetical protein ACI312_01200 [Bacilli bacterium]
MRDILANFPTEIVELYDTNNNKIKELTGFFGKTGLTITDTSTPIVEGQLIVRKLPNGSIENYTIIESKYNVGHNDICSFYKLSLRKNNIKQSNIRNDIYIDNSIHIGNNNKIDKSNIGNNN